MKLGTFLLIAFSLVACARVSRVQGPDGTHGWYSIRCNQNQGVCQRKASEVCPSGYVTADSGGGYSFTGAHYGGYTSYGSSYSGQMLIKCQVGGAGGAAEEARDTERARDEAMQEDAALIAIQKHPKFPELGAPKPEAKATCSHERGQWVDQGEKVGCKIKGEFGFACMAAEDGTMRACTRYKLGADLTDERDTIAETNGKPTSVAPGERGFRTYTWDSSERRIVLTGYPAGVIVTETKVTEGEAQ